MVRDTLQTNQRIQENDSRFRAALVFSKTADMLCTQADFKLIKLSLFVDYLESSLNASIAYR